MQRSQKMNSSTSFELDYSSTSNDENYVRNRSPLLKKYPPPKTTIAAVIFLLLGTIFLIVGGSVFWQNQNEKSRGIAMIVLGGISKNLFF
jgi:hypothetical protein